jgi:penicillin G amidase
MTNQHVDRRALRALRVLRALHVLRVARAFVLLGLCILVVPVVSGQQGGDPAAELKGLARRALAQIDGTLAVRGLREPVEVVRDQWGVPHIFARNTDDLFFAQGYVMGQDRLWQLEMWRRQREGRLSEILGPETADRDRQARLLMYRGTFDDPEFTSYHPEGKRIFTAFVNGLNAYIAPLRNSPDKLPIEFALTGITPTPWTIETVLLRSPSLGDATSELQLARLVARLGVREANRQRMPDPWDELTIPEGLDVTLIPEEATARGGAARLPRPSIAPAYQHLFDATSRGIMPEDAAPEPGSNNWVIAGARSATGKPIVANDPHREVTNPSLRYIVHLNAPGWNVIGAGEAPFVGVAIGHNDRLAWGLTITGTDQHDVYIEEVNPTNANEVRYNGGWEPLRIVREQLPIKGQAPRTIELKFSRHGPIFFEDAKNRRVYALRSALNEPGTAAYLGGLRLAQSRDCKEFLEAALYWKAPTENLICGDVDNNISFQGSALTPKRVGWSGRLPVPGIGKYEWQGFRTDLPRLLNPAQGYIATANNNVNVPGTPAVMFKTLNNVMFERVKRLDAVIGTTLFTRKFTLDDSRQLQHDAFSLRGALERDLFKGWAARAVEVEKARALVAGWDGVLRKESAPAAIYITWREAVDRAVFAYDRPFSERQSLVEAGLSRAIAQLTKEQGMDWTTWRYGRMHTRDFPHPFVRAFDLPTVERSGGNGAVAADGASYREIMDVADWDRSIVTNVPGQSGQPESRFYGNLLPLWDRAEYFPLLFTRARIDRDAAHKLTITPP